MPNVGKSTLFNCLSSAKAQAANFPFCTIDAQMGQITVPDERLNKLAELVHPGRIVPATCDIVDIAGLVKGASKGEGLGNQFLGNIRETDAIIHVLRCFDNDNIVHVDGSVDPVRDKEIIDTELQLKDLETIENRIKRVEKVAKVGGDKQAKLEYDVLWQYKQLWNKANRHALSPLKAKTNSRRPKTFSCSRPNRCSTSAMWTTPLPPTVTHTWMPYAKPSRTKMPNCSSSQPKRKPTLPNWKATRKNRCSWKTWG